MTMKTTLIALTALASVAGGLTLPAMANAQSAYVRADVGGWDRRDDGWDRRGGYDRGGYDRGGWQINSRIERLRDWIDRAEDSGRLSHREAVRLEWRLRRIADMKRDFERSGRGLDGREVAMLNDRLDDLSRDVRYEGHDGNRW